MSKGEYMRIAIASLVLVSAGALQAQTSSSTNCWANGAYVNCTTQTQPDYMANFNKGIENMQRQLQAIQEQKAVAAQAAAQAFAYERAINIRKHAGQLASSGDCKSARDYAAEQGEFQLSSEVYAYCKQRESDLSAARNQQSAQQLAPSGNRQTRIVPEGTFLSSQTDIGNGKMKCSFNNGFTRVIPIGSNCFEP